MDLRDLRKSYGYNQAKLGSIANIGQDTISNIENFKQEMSIDTAIKLSPYSGNIDPLQLCFDQSRGILLKRLDEAKEIKLGGIKKMGAKSLFKLIRNLGNLLDDDFLLNDIELATKLIGFAIRISNAFKQIKNIWKK